MSFDTLPIITRDPGQVELSLGLLRDQLIDGWRHSRSLKLPQSYSDICHVAVCGMGGSHLGADIIRSVAADVLPGPVSIVADYALPAWIDRWTPVICSSSKTAPE